MKWPLYARAGVGEAWLVALEASRIEIHRGPGSSGYHDVSIPGADEGFCPLAFPDLTITTRDLLG